MGGAVYGSRRGEDGEHGAGVYLGAGADREFGDDAGGRGVYGVFELHRFQGEEEVSGGDVLAGDDQDPADHAG